MSPKAVPGPPPGKGVATAGVRVVSVPQRQEVQRLQFVSGPDGEAGRLEERQFPFRDFHLTDGRVVTAAWDGSERVLYVWEPHYQLYGAELLGGLASGLAAEVPRKSGPAPAWRPRCVLLVEDDPTMVRMVRRLLEKAGYVVVSTDSPFAMGPLLRQAKPSLVLVDVGLPAIRGDALVNLVQSGEAGPGCPMVLFSACDESELAALAQASGAAGYICKQEDLSNLVERVEAFLAGGG